MLNQALFLVIILLLIYIYYKSTFIQYLSMKEDFKTISEKTNAYINAFKSGHGKTYQELKKYMPEANIIEYTKMKSNNGNLKI